MGNGVQPWLVKACRATAGAFPLGRRDGKAPKAQMAPAEADNNSQALHFSSHCTGNFRLSLLQEAKKEAQHMKRGVLKSTTFL